MSRYVPPSKRKEEKATFDPKTLNNDALFPSLGGPVAQKMVKEGFKEVIEERLRKEAEDAVRSTQPVDIKSLSIPEREALGFVTLKVGGHTREEMIAISERMNLRISLPPKEEEWY